MRRDGALAQLARRRLVGRPPPPDTPEMVQAKVDFFEALVDRDQRKAKAAVALLAHRPGPAPLQTPQERAKRERRMRAVVRWAAAVRELREQERQGVVSPAPTPERAREAADVAARFTRWMKGDDSAGDFDVA